MQFLLDVLAGAEMDVTPVQRRVLAAVCAVLVVLMAFLLPYSF